MWPSLAPRAHVEGCARTGAAERGPAGSRQGGGTCGWEARGAGARVAGHSSGAVAVVRCGGWSSGGRASCWHARTRTAAAGARRQRPAGGRWQGIGGSELGEREHVCMAGSGRGRDKRFEPGDEGRGCESLSVVSRQKASSASSLPIPQDDVLDRPSLTAVRMGSGDPG